LISGAALAQSGSHITLGDFNLHHPLWAGLEYGTVDEEATNLIDIMDSRGLEQLLPPGTVTYETRESRTTIDLVWASHSLAGRLTRCVDRREWWFGADHVPIHTEFSLTVPRAAVVYRKQWNATDWGLFTKLIETHSWCPQPLTDQDLIDAAVTALVTAITDAAESATPTKQITSFSRPGYTPEMAELKHEVNRRRRHAKYVNTPEAWDAYKEAKVQMKRQSNQLARDLHRSRIEEATQSIDGFWRVARWVRNRGTPRVTFTPTLHHDRTEYTDPADKTALFRRVLHPEPPEADLSDLNRFQYPIPLECPPITIHKLRDAIHHTKPNKAPGPDGIPNLVIQHILPMIESYLLNLELEGINAALMILGKQQYGYTGPREATIYTDNQAAIQACGAPRRSSGQYILRRIVNRISQLHDWRIQIQWVPGHEGVPGNEVADQLAKRAAVDAASRTRTELRIARINAPNQTTPHAARMINLLDPDRDTIMYAVARQRLRAAFNDWWKQDWERARFGRHTYRIFDKPIKQVLGLHTGLIRAWSSVLIQLQTGKNALCSFLAAINVIESANCPCGLGRQDEAHVLTQCPLFRQLRDDTLWKDAREMNPWKLLREPSWVRKSIGFILRTGLLTQFHGVGIPPDQRLQ
jgi:Endonuclease-reverse transcriptase/RNase H